MDTLPGSQLGVLQLLVDIGAFAGAMSGAAMAIAIGYALKAPPLVLFSLAAVGYASNARPAGAGGPLAVLIIAILSAEAGKLVSKETKVDLLVTPLVTILLGCALSMWWAPAIGQAASYPSAISSTWATDAPALLDGHGGVGAGGHCPDAAHLQRRHLPRPAPLPDWPAAQRWPAAAPRWWASRS